MLTNSRLFQLNTMIAYLETSLSEETEYLKYNTGSTPIETRRVLTKINDMRMRLKEHQIELSVVNAIEVLADYR